MKMVLNFILDQWKVIENVQSMDGNIIFLLYNDDSGCFVEDGRYKQSRWRETK